MKVIGDTAYFKSVPYQFYQEESGYTPNTIRILTKQEFLKCKADVVKITICNTETAESFTRDLLPIKDVTKFMEPILKDDFEGKVCIFSWRA
jgi:hypothetical protein